MNLLQCFKWLFITLFIAPTAITEAVADTSKDVSYSSGQLLTLATNKAHPRTITAGEVKTASFSAALIKATGIATTSQHAPIKEPVWEKGNSKAHNLQAVRDSMRIQGVVAQEGIRILALSLAGLRNNDPPTIASAKVKAVAMARWQQTGATSFLENDQAGRIAALALSLAYDWLYKELSDGERGVIAAAVKHRVTEMMSGAPPYGLDRGRKLDRSPLDSHAISTLAHVAVICTAMAGHDPVFNDCFMDTVPRYVARPMPWGGNDGGFANGTAYAHWATLGSHFFAWDLLKNAIGVNLWEKPWAIGYGRYIAYFLPPGAPAGVFGDETEKRLQNVWATQARIYATRNPSPLANWYARNQIGESTEHLPTLLLPYRDWSQLPGGLPAKIAHAAHFPDIGWVAMHSDLGDRARTSIYFKSSPFGSHNHSHADQNSFVIHARGRALAIDSGYYDYYGSPHWTEWYKQTRAHNAVTFDGGQGQLHDTLAAKGRILRFEHHDDHDIAVGDAVAAYGGALKRALRTVVFLRPNTVIIFDSLASDSPRKWEWNLHAPTQMAEFGERRLEVNTEGVRLCADLAHAPDGRFVQTDRFSAEPQGKYAAQWHVRFSTTTKTKSARFVAVLDVDCAGGPAESSESNGKSIIKVNGREMEFAATGEVVVK